MNKPDFIIIGSMKCGTTVLWHNLNKHPDIEMIKNPEDPKKASTEIRFWNNGQPHRTFNKGIEWYFSLFNKSFCGEKCANYIENKNTMKKIHDNIDKIKLVLCVREPVDRAYSEFRMQFPNATEDKFNFNSIKKNGYSNRSKYFSLIEENILPFFRKEDLYIIVQEEMKKNTDNELNKLYKFLGVSEFHLDTNTVSSELATNRNLDLEKDKKIKSYKVWNSKYKPMNPELKKILKDYFLFENKKLFNFLGYEIKDWR